mmetsp:Transcript_14162/g.34075  ORF Transcript_14162/g.34075 Transcript_14162/m.34075 type:complete len:244 (-) Transcript_14162:551-1282(-)
MKSENRSRYGTRRSGSVDTSMRTLAYVIPLVGCSSSCRGVPLAVLPCWLPHRLISRGTASATISVGSTLVSCLRSCEASSATASFTMVALASSSSAAEMAATWCFSSSSSLLSYSLSALPTTVTRWGLSRNRRFTSCCQKVGSASSAAFSLAASMGVRRERRPSPPCTHVPMAPKATPRPKEVVVRAALSSTWCMTASTRSRGKPSTPILARVSAMRFSTSSTSASATPLRPTAKEVSRREPL